jgi:hypothetical protein
VAVTPFAAIMKSSISALARVEIERAALMPPRVERARGAILHLDLLVEPGHSGEPRRRGRGAVEPRGDAVVGQLRLIEDTRAIHVRLRHLALGVDGHLDHDGEPILVLVQRREIGRELLRQHRKDAGGGVDRGRVRARVLVDRRAFLDERIHVGNRDQDLRGVAERFRDRELIEILRVVVVDRRPQPIAQVAHALGVAGCGVGCVADRLGFGDRGGREVRLQAVLEHRAAGDAGQVVTVRGHGQAII